VIDIEARDVDVPLSQLGERQAGGPRLLVRVVAAGPTAKCRPLFALPSRPKHRQRRSRQGGLATDFSELIIDERLREEEFGILDRLTRLGIEERHPELAAARGKVGKFYFRPPGGESWCDVILRLRSVLDIISLHYGEKRVRDAAAGSTGQRQAGRAKSLIGERPEMPPAANLEFAIQAGITLFPSIGIALHPAPAADR
jgi:probable phosphoglycerate mutase